MPSMEKSDALRLEEYGNSKFLKRTWPGCAAYLRNLSKRLLFGEDTLRPALEAEIKRLRNLASGAMSLVDGQMFAKRADSLAEILERNPAATPPLPNVEAVLDHLSDSKVLGIFAGQETPEDAGGEGGEDDRERIAQLFQRWAREKRAAAKHFVGPNKDHTIWFAKGLDCAADYLLTFTPGQFPAPDGEER